MSIKMRMSILKKIHNFFLNCGDEEWYEIWITEGVPDEPSREDFAFIASDAQEFYQVVKFANKLIYHMNKAIEEKEG